MFTIPALIWGLIFSFPTLAYTYKYEFEEELKDEFIPVPTFFAMF